MYRQVTCNCGLNVGQPHVVARSTFYRHQRRLERLRLRESNPTGRSLAETDPSHVNNNPLSTSDLDVASPSLARDDQLESGNTEAAPQLVYLIEDSPEDNDDDDDDNDDDDMSSRSEYSDDNPEWSAPEVASGFDYIESRFDRLDPPKVASIRMVSHKLDTSGTDGQHDSYVGELNQPLAGHGMTHQKLLSISATRRLLADWTSIKHVSHDCCVNSCIAYTGSYAELDTCPVCGEPRLSSSGQARSVFDYIPITHRLKLQYSDPSRAKVMSEHRNQVLSQDPTHEQIQDFCQTDHFNDLKRKGFFSDRRDLAMYLSTDDVSLFKFKQHSVWPIILVNMNLPLEMRMKTENVMLVGIIPGPNAPTNLNTFLFDLVKEFQSLAKGVDCWDAHLQEHFALRAHICFVLGDQRAASLMVGHSGYNHYLYCRICLYQGLRADGAVRCPHRPPVDIATVITGTQASRNRQFRPFRITNLPLRLHDEHVSDATRVSINGYTEITDQSGVAGWSILLSLRTMLVPVSTPVGIMHALFEELEPLMWSLWSGTGLLYKHGNRARARSDQPWRISESHLAALGRDLEASNATFPSAFGRPLRNINTYHESYEASDSMVWMMQLSPILLAGRLPDPFYTKWCSLVRAIHELTRPFKRSRIPHIKAQIIKFVEHFERDYYQYRAENLRMCQTCIHYLLHLTDSAVGTGVLTQNSEFLMERYVGMIKSKLKSRNRADRNLSLNCLLMEQLNHISYVCKNFSQEPLHHKPQHLRGLISSPAPVSAVLSAFHWDMLLDFLYFLLDRPMTHVKKFMGKRTDYKFRKFFRYGSQVHDIGCQEERAKPGQDVCDRANYNVRYSDDEGQHYGTVQYFGEVTTPIGLSEVALVFEMEVSVDNRDLLLVTGKRLTFIPCESIDGLIGLVSRDDSLYVLNPEAVLMLNDMDE